MKKAPLPVKIFLVVQTFFLFALERAAYHAADIAAKKSAKLWRDHGLSLNKRWLSRSRALRDIQFKSWRIASGFPEPGWWARGKLAENPDDSQRSSLVNHCLSDPALQWSNPDPKAVDDIRHLLDYKAVQACQSDMSAFAAAYVFERIPDACSGHADFFRNQLTQADPQWHLREATGEIAHFLRASDPVYADEIERQRQRQQAHLEREQIASSADAALRTDAPRRSRRI
jgi:hypothetical protein